MEVESITKKGKKPTVKRNGKEDLLKKKILPMAIVCFVVAVIVIIFLAAYSIDTFKNNGCTAMYCSDNPTFLQIIQDKAMFIGLTLFMSILAIAYLPYIGLIGYSCAEALTISQAISILGFGAIKYIVPLVINVVVISVITSVSLYISKISWYKGKIRRKNNMNFTNFRLQFYNMIKDQKKYDKLNQKYNSKNEQYEKKIEKIDWKKLWPICAWMLALQVISAVIEYIVF